MGLITDAMAAHWAWLTFGLLLGAVELVAPGFFMIWLGVAAIATGLMTYAIGLTSAGQLMLFAATSIGFVMSARRWIQYNPIETDDPLLNDRAARLVGETVTVIEPLSETAGRAKLGDSVWNARGPEARPGTPMRVIGTRGTTLLLEAIAK